jgi:hypothetical protein
MRLTRRDNGCRRPDKAVMRGVLATQAVFPAIVASQYGQPSPFDRGGLAANGLYRCSAAPKMGVQVADYGRNVLAIRNDGNYRQRVSVRAHIFNS